MIADLDTGEVLAAKDPHGRYRPASTLKLLTAQVMLQNLTEPGPGGRGHTGRHRPGGHPGGHGGRWHVQRQELLTYLMMISGNDAANALARVNGGYDKTVADMNATAKALGALDTRAATGVRVGRPRPVPRPPTTSRCSPRPTWRSRRSRRSSSSVDVRVPAAEGEGYIAANDNQLLAQYPGALGGKTGFTDDAGNTYVGMAAQDGRRLVVTMIERHPAAAAAVDAGRIAAGLGLRAARGYRSGRRAGELAGRSDRRTDPDAQHDGVRLDVCRTSASAGPAASTPVSAGGSIPTAGESSSGIPVAWILAGIGLLVVAAGVFLLIRRRALNKRATFAGDAKPMPDPGATGAATSPESNQTEPDEADPSVQSAGPESQTPEPETQATEPETQAPTEVAGPADAEPASEVSEAVPAADAEPAKGGSAEPTDPNSPGGDDPGKR